MADNVLSTAEAAEILGITVRAVQGLCQRETLEAKKVSGVYVIDRGSVEEYKVKKEGEAQEKINNQ